MVDSTLLGCCAICGSCSFVAAYVFSAPQGSVSTRGLVKSGSFARLVRRIQTLRAVQVVESKANRSLRRAECLRQMPVMLDVVTLGLQAGLSFDSALELYCHRYDNVLAKALGNAMTSWRLGTASREEALEQMAQQMEVTSLDRFAGVVTQALAFGSPLAATLEQQAQAIRDEQRSQMEEEIEQVPVRMLIPLGTLIVPAMLLALLGPLLGASLQMG